ncbi:RNA-directed DNA polymerase, eukaryota [Tanacetum coccineum]
MSFYKSNEELTQKISQSVFVTNFPDFMNSRDLWKMCSAYGMVVDVFIPFKKSKSGFRQSNGRASSYATAINGSSPLVVPSSSISPSPALVLDDTCVIDRDLSKHAMGRVKDINSIPNLRTLLMDEGFSDVKLMYLGGMWVMFEFDKVDTKVNMMQHTGVNSWFHTIQDAVQDFVSDERIVWVDIEGIPLNVWSRETFIRIESILESFKIIVKGKVFMVRAKELFTWNPTFLAHKEMVFSSDDESVHASKQTCTV